MSRKPDWTQEEFETIISNPTLSSEMLAKKFPRRSMDSVELIRSGIHAFHTGKNTSMLSKLMLARLEDSQNKITCPICGIVC